ncbi:hypothetical protein [Chitinophaga japonensis]|uniref:Lipoprotein n=1 Tax=Chitinophaga japonensis TaxID=104662 RepID=A0A562SJS1_CHIJA|nr:hypothetical protein [Chitinophaga japonensis]TWI81040.1 hypothetical protein LX66_5646 [Chitinophaga japonensis]
MNRLLILLLAVGILAGCGSGKDRANGDNPLTFEDFEALFPEKELPYRLMADSLGQNPADTLVLKPAVLQQFLTDTMAAADFPEKATPRFFPLAHFEGEHLHYFVVEAVSKSRAAAYLCFTDKEGRYLNRVLVASKAAGSKDRLSFTLDSKYLVKISTEMRLGPSHTALKEDFYMAQPDGQLTLIMTNSNGPAMPGQIFNPIDTLPGKHKFSADYTSGDLNIISIRDGPDPKTFLFFISFSRENGSCKGELSGTGHFTGSNRGEYKDKESSCGIAFQFSSRRVSIREIGGCGAYRGIKCLFEGSFTKKRINN